MNQSLKLTFSSMLTAVSTVIMVLSGIIPVGTYAIPAIAGIFTAPAVIELGPGWAMSVYAAVSILSALLAGDKEAVLCYIALFGCYPVVKAQIEKKCGKASGISLKFAFFNVTAVAGFYIAIYVLSVPKNSFSLFGIYLPWIFLLIGNVVFALYDYALSLLIVAYCKKFHHRISKWLQLH